MKTDQIWRLPASERLDAFIDRWRELEARTGNRTLEERTEMLHVADAILTVLIDERERAAQTMTCVVCGARALVRRPAVERKP